MARPNSQTPPRQSMASHRPHDRGNDNQAKSQANDIWLQRAADSFDASTSFMENNYRAEWENNIRHFQNKHGTDSKYLTDQYKYRTRHFRPKTRSMVRNNEAAVAGAFFSQLDVVSVDALDEKDPLNAAAAGLRHQILNYRLNETIPWFQLCLGAAQDAHIYGVIASKQSWISEYDTYEEDVIVDGQPTMNEDGSPARRKVKTKRKDHPDIRLYPIENVRFDPSADWTDVVNTSPYFIALEPLKVGEVRARIKSKEFLPVDDSVLLTARNAAFEPLRRARDGDREDATDPRFNKELSDFDTVFVHENFLKIDGEDHHYYTLGCSARLTEPTPVGKVYLHGIRPFRIGTCVIEAHKAIPDAPVHLMKGLQKETNDISNTRSDNVKLALNKRYLVRRGKQVDLQSLLRNAPASITMVTDIEKDVLPLEFNDVTRSSYEEQDRVSVDADELMGSFSQSSVMSNRKLNETVGGMGMIKQSSNSLTQYTIRVFAETWVEPVLRQLDLLEQHYESDVELLAVMSRKAGWIEKYQLDLMRLTDEQVEAIMTLPATVKVNVANSAMDPLVRLDAFLYSLRTYAEMSQILPPDVDRRAVKEVIFAFLGFKDARRFSIDEGNMSPEAMAIKAQYEQQIQALTQEIAKLKSGHDIKVMEAEQRMQIEMAEMQQRLDIERERASVKIEQERAEGAVRLALLREQGQLQLALQQEKGENELEMDAIKMAQEEARAERELAINTKLELRQQDLNATLTRRKNDQAAKLTKEKNAQQARLRAQQLRERKQQSKAA